MKSRIGLVVTLACGLAATEPAMPQASLESIEVLEVQASLEELAQTEAELEDALQQLRERRKLLEENQEGATGSRGERERVRIVNGVLTWDFPTAGALLRGESVDAADSHCTGTLIGCRTFLTANHCVHNDRDPDHYFVYLQQAGIFPVEAISEADPEYAFPHADYAVLRLGTRVQGIRPMPLNREVVPLGTSGEIVGFGRSGGFRRDYGLKRAGRVQTAKCDRAEPSLLCWDFDATVGLPGEDSNTCNTDSGGPLFVDFGSGPVIAGITSGGSQVTCLEGDHSYDVDVRQFLAQIEEFAGDDLGARSCGELPVVGSAEVQSFGDSRLLGSSGAQDYEIELPEGLAHLRFAMNGQDESSIDFDLLVNHGSTATPGSSDCEQDGPSQYAFCEFDQPAGGSWFVRVRQKGPGSGLFQVVATIVGGPS